jgi:hypothetical protein
VRPITVMCLEKGLIGGPGSLPLLVPGGYVTSILNCGQKRESTKRITNMAAIRKNCVLMACSEVIKSTSSESFVTSLEESRRTLSAVASRHDECYRRVRTGGGVGQYPRDTKQTTAGDLQCRTWRGHPPLTNNYCMQRGRNKEQRK